MLVTSYNRRGFLETALDSVLAQTFEDLHLVVIDDASDDGTAELLDTYQRRAAGRLAVLIKPARRGYVDPINSVLALLKGARHVAFLNDDATWHPEKLDAQVRVLERDDGVGLVATEAMIIDEHGNPTGQLFSDIYGALDVARPAWQIFWHWNRPCLSSVVATRQALDLVQPYERPDGGCNDMAMWLTIGGHLPIRWLQEPLGCYRHTPDQMIKARGRAMERETFTLRDDALESSPELRRIVGAEAGRRRLDSDALFWMAWWVRRWQWRRAAWFAWRATRRRRQRLLLLVGYIWLTSVVRALGDALGRGRPQPDVE